MLYFIGDIHCEYEQLISKLTYHNITDSTLIQVGDFGVGYRDDEEDSFKAINFLLRSRRNRLFIIRGNHDDPSYFKGDRKIGQMIFLKDYSLLEIRGKKILLAGGGISINRKDKTRYFQNEAFAYDEKKLNEALSGIDKLDMVVTHSAPSEFQPHEFSDTIWQYVERDAHLLQDLQKERGAHSLLLEYLQARNLAPKFWYYGHFHTEHRGEFEKIKYRAVKYSDIVQHL